MRTAARHLAAPCTAIDELASSRMVQSAHGFGFEPADDRSPAPCRLPPVDVADFVSGGVVAVIEMLDADAGPTPDGPRAERVRQSLDQQLRGRARERLQLRTRSAAQRGSELASPSVDHRRERGVRIEAVELALEAQENAVAQYRQRNAPRDHRRRRASGRPSPHARAPRGPPPAARAGSRHSGCVGAAPEFEPLASGCVATIRSTAASLQRSASSTVRHSSVMRSTSAGAGDRLQRVGGFGIERHVEHAPAATRGPGTAP